MCTYMLPGDPARIILGPQASAETVTRFRSEYRLDQSLAAQYVSYASKVAKLDLGDSFAQRQPVTHLLLVRGITSFSLAISAFCIAIAIGIFLPLLLAMSGSDRLNTIFGLILQAFAFPPPYLLAVAALGFVAGFLKIAPVMFDPSSGVSWLVAAIVLSAYPSALLFRLFIQCLGREMSQPYARRAAASGFSRQHVLWREVFRNACAEPLASATNAMAFFFTSAFFVETVFGIGGLGRLAQEAIRQKDVATLNGVCLALCALVTLTSLTMDAVHRVFFGKSEATAR
jgi:peptide/nickel transport system permease protein